MWVAHDVRAREPAAVDDRCVVQLVREDDVAFAERRRKHRQVGQEPRRQQHCAVHALELGQALFELHVQPLRPRDTARAADSDPAGLNRVDRGCFQLRGGGESEVVVRAQVQDGPPVHGQPGALRRVHHSRVH